MAENRKILSNSIHMKIVTTYEEMMHAVAVRSISFIEEQNIETGFILDANDHNATNVIAYDGDEPIGTARIRWFNGFVKIERSSFRPKYRHPRNLILCAEFIFEHVARKGYSHVITHAAPRYARVWCHFLGFKKVEGKKPMLIAGHDEPYIEIEKFLDPVEDAITHETDSVILFREEGKWGEKMQYEITGG